MTELTGIIKLIGSFSSTPPVLVMLGILAYLLSQWMKERKSQEFKTYVKNNEFEHKEIFNRMDSINIGQEKILNYFEIQTCDNDSIKRMHQIKSYYIDKFEVEKYKLFAIYKADLFIESLQNILKKCTDNQEKKLNIDCLDYVINNLSSEYEVIKNEMYGRFNNEYVDLYLKTSKEAHNDYLRNIEEILSDFENHHKERFLKVSTVFLKRFLINLNKSQIEGV